MGIKENGCLSSRYHSLTQEIDALFSINLRVSSRTTLSPPMNTRMRRLQQGLNSASRNDEWAFVWSKLSIHFSQASQRSEEDGWAIVNLQTPVHQRARLAQSVEHETLNLRVVGSSPTLGANIFLLFKRYFFWIHLNNWETGIMHVILWQQPSNWTFCNVGLQSMQIT